LDFDGCGSRGGDRKQGCGRYAGGEFEDGHSFAPLVGSLVPQRTASSAYLAAVTGP
jgi:hypothetical protein